MYSLRVCSSVPEAVDTGSARTTSGIRPVQHFCRNLQAPFLELDVGVRVVIVHLGRNLSILDGQDRFDDPGKTRSTLLRPFVSNIESLYQNMERQTAHELNTY